MSNNGRGAAAATASWRAIGGFSVGEQIRCRVGQPLDAFLDGAAPPVLIRQPRLVTADPVGRAFGDYCPDPGVGGGRADCLLAAHRHADGRDPSIVDVGLRPEERHRCRRVVIAVPAEVHGPAATATVTPGVE